jgi:hypothetical protein
MLSGVSGVFAPAGRFFTGSVMPHRRGIYWYPAVMIPPGYSQTLTFSFMLGLALEASLPPCGAYFQLLGAAVSPSLPGG